VENFAATAGTMATSANAKPQEKRGQKLRGTNYLCSLPRAVAKDAGAKRARALLCLPVPD